METLIFNYRRLAESICFLLLFLLLPSCNLFLNPVDKLELDRAYVGIFNTVERYGTGTETTDVIEVVNNQYDEYMGLNKDCYLVWQGNSFTVNYTDIHTSDNNWIMTTEVEMTGTLSTDQKSLLTFSGTHKLTQHDLDINSYDIVEQRLSVRNVPLERSGDMLSCQINGNITSYVVDAYWKHTFIEKDNTSVAETGALNLISSNNQLQVDLYKEY